MTASEAKAGQFRKCDTNTSRLFRYEASEVITSNIASWTFLCPLVNVSTNTFIY
jgi:hypothetical protein